MRRSWVGVAILAALGGVLVSAGVALRAQAQAPADPSRSSYQPVREEDFKTVFARMSAAKAGVMARQMNLLNARYDLSDRPAAGVTMSRGKPVQDGVRVKLPAGVTWDRLASATPDQIREQGLFPAGFMPLPHPNHPEGGMLFPASRSTRSRSRRRAT